MKKETQNMMKPDYQDPFEDDNEGGMAGLARSLGLDIDALAVELALKDDIAPAQTHQIDTNEEEAINIVETVEQPEPAE